MDRRYNGHIGTKIAVIPYGDFGIVLDCQVEISEEISADFGVFSVVKRNGTLDTPAFSEFADDLGKDFRPFFLA